MSKTKRVKVTATVVAEDADHAADVLREIIADKVALGYTGGFEKDPNDGSYHFQVEETV